MKRLALQWFIVCIMLVISQYLYHRKLKIISKILLIIKLTKNKSVQKKAQQEVDNVLSTCNGQLTADGLDKLTYIENCLYGKMIFIIENIYFHIILVNLQKHYV